MIKVALVLDFDLTCSEEYQQIPLINEYLEQYKKCYNTPEMKEYFKKYHPKFAIPAGA